MWHYSKDGNYSIKSDYQVCFSQNDWPDQSCSEEMEKWWSSYQRPQIPPKIKIFGWKAFKDYIPSGVNLGRKGIGEAERCEECGHFGEDSLHAL